MREVRTAEALTHIIAGTDDRRPQRIRTLTGVVCALVGLAIIGMV